MHKRGEHRLYVTRVTIVGHVVQSRYIANNFACFTTSIFPHLFIRRAPLLVVSEMARAAACMLTGLTSQGLGVATGATVLAHASKNHGSVLVQFLFSSCSVLVPDILVLFLSFFIFIPITMTPPHDIDQHRMSGSMGEGVSEACRESTAYCPLTQPA